MADPQEIKVGVYCAADEEVSSALDLDAMEKVATGEMKAAFFKRVENLSSDEGMAGIKKDIESEGLNRVVVLDRSARTFPGLFDFGPDVLVDVVPLRELVIWTHEPNDEDTQMLAEDYLRMFVARAQHTNVPEADVPELTKRVLVVGGGVAGMRSALNIARTGIPVTLVEKEDHLGGWASKFTTSFPSTPPYDRLANGAAVRKLIEDVQGQADVDIKLSTTIKKIKGQPGSFAVTLQNGGAPEELVAGTIVQATGWRPYSPKKLSHLGYGAKNVVTNVQLEKMFTDGKVVKPSDGAAPESIAFVQCAGSRDKDHLPYCSGVCCRASLKQAMQLRELYPDAKIYIIYKDIRSPGQYELFYQAAQDDPGMFLTKGEVGEVRETSGGGVSIDVDETLLGEPITVEADMLVLAAGMVPTTKVEDDVFEGEGEETLADAAVKQDADQEGGPETGATPTEERVAESAVTEEGMTEDGMKAAAGAEKGARILNLTYRQGTDLPTLKYGFPDSHFICFPYETRRTGIYAAGCVRAPMDQAQTANDANGAALKAVQALNMMEKGLALHPRSRDRAWPKFYLERCTQCKRCTEDCPFGALDEDVKGTPQPNLARCRRCGTCMGACPERIINFQNYSVPMGNNMIKAIEMPDEDDEKPRILAFVCENDALPALETAARKRMKFNPWIRIVPVRCLGSVNAVWMTNALDKGYDGILLVGCKHGDDYQCHFVRGSELAEYRMDNVQEKLKQMMLEEERVQVSSVPIDGWQEIIDIFEEYSEEIEEMGPNPFKEF